MSKLFQNGHALLIGVGGDLPNTVDDATGIANILKDPERCAYRPERVDLLTGQQATRTSVFAALDRLAGAAGPRDTVIIYFSGHGYRVDSPTGTFYYLMPFGYNVSSLYQTAISGSELAARLRGIEARRLLLLLDCCHAGGIGETKTPGVTINKSARPEDITTLFAQGAGRVMIASSQSDELSYAGKPYSAFTLALIEALSGVGVGRRDGYVRVVDLALHSRQVVPQRTRDRQHPVLEFEQADNFAIAYYAGGSRQVKGSPVPTPQIEEWAGQLRGFNQQGQQVSGNQTNIAGDVTGPVLSGTFEGAVSMQIFQGTTFVGEQAIDWNNVEADYQRATERAARRFYDHMRALAGARTDDEALARYRPPRLQETQYRSLPTQPAAEATDGTQPFLAPGETLVVTGDAGSGKTTFLLYQALQLALHARTRPDASLPIYVSLRTYNGGNRDTLLDLLAQAGNLPNALLHALWSGDKRRVTLLLDGADEAPGDKLEELVEALDNLIGSNTQHNILIASRPGRFRTLLASRRSNLREWVLMPLNDAEIDALLDGYNQPQLKGLLQINPLLREVLQTPDLIAGLALAADGGWPVDEPPNNAGRIYQLLMRRRFMGQSNYDYERIKLPILAKIAYDMLLNDRISSPCDDGLYDLIAEQIKEFATRYDNRRKVLPSPWLVEDLLAELFQSGVVELLHGRPPRISFTKSGFRDYFAAVQIARLNGADAKLLDTMSVRRDTSQRWNQVLILLLGFWPEAGKLFDELYEPDPLLAAQFWFETRPKGGNSPDVLVENYARREQIIADQWQARDDEATTRVFYRWLNQFDQHQQRLQAVVAISQWGYSPSLAVRLLDALDDDEPMVRAVAEYALLRMGEPSPLDFRRPLPPLFDLDGTRLRFRSFGGCNAELGPLTLIKVPNPALVSCDIEIQQLDFDPFDPDLIYTIDAPPPELLASHMIETTGQLNLLDLLARYHLIATYSAQIAVLADARTGRARTLATRLQRRAQQYVALGSLLAADLLGDRPWQPVPNISIPAEISQNAQRAYLQARRLFSRTNINRIRELAAQSREILARTPEQYSERIPEKLNLGVIAEAIELDPELLAARTSTRPFTHYNVVRSFQRIEGKTVIGAEYASLKGITTPYPIMLRVNILLDIRRLTKEANLIGLRIGKLTGGLFGWKPHTILRIGQFEKSQLTGIIVNDS